MPVWYEKTKDLIARDKLVVLGVTQEQHPDRCRLFAQWKGIDWPILHDPLNLVGVDVVPVFVAIDESGIVRSTNVEPDSFQEKFVNRKYKVPKKTASVGEEELPDPRITRRLAGEARDAEHWRLHGDALVLSGKHQHIKEAITAYPHALEYDKKDAAALFRLGVARRMRHDSPQREAGDFQAAVDAWQKALKLEPNNYIYRRRIQQYGPRLDKPYPFYDWVETARKEIAASGETPVVLTCEPTGAELAAPARKFKSNRKKGPEGDPGEKIHKDIKGLIQVGQAFVRGTGKKKKSYVQVHLTFRPNTDLDAHWNNEAEPLRLWLKKPKAGKLAVRYVEYANPPEATGTEDRTLTFAYKLPARKKGTQSIKGYVLYNVCEGAEGKCRLLRRNISIKIKAK